MYVLNSKGIQRELCWEWMESCLWESRTCRVCWNGDSLPSGCGPFPITLLPEPSWPSSLSCEHNELGGRGLDDRGQGSSAWWTNEGAGLWVWSGLPAFLGEIEFFSERWQSATSADEENQEHQLVPWFFAHLQSPRCPDLTPEDFPIHSPGPAAHVGPVSIRNMTAFIFPSFLLLYAQNRNRFYFSEIKVRVLTRQFGFNKKMIWCWT